MKKFKYALAISGTVAEREALIPKLLDMGYVWAAENRYDGEAWPHLLTSYSNDGSLIGRIGYRRNSGSHLEADASKPELVLALAAMVDDSHYYKGEWLYCVGGYINIGGKCVCTVGKLYCQVNDEDRPQFISDIGVKDGFYGKRNFRKATKEEIINHFSGRDKTVDSRAEKRVADLTSVYGIDTEIAPINHSGGGILDTMTWVNKPDNEIVYITRSKKKHKLLTF